METVWKYLNISTSKKVITYSQDSLQAWEKLTSYWWALGLTNNIKKDITLNFQWVYFIFVACAQLRNLWWFCAARFWSKSKSVLLWLVVWMDCWLLRWLSCCAVFFFYLLFGYRATSLDFSETKFIENAKFFFRDGKNLELLSVNTFFRWLVYIVILEIWDENNKIIQ